MSEATSASRRARVVVHSAATLCVAAFAGALSAAPAQAQADNCRASASRVAAPPSATSEPVIANPDGSPCGTDARTPADAAPAGPLNVTEPSAQTRRGNGVLAASASVRSAQLTLGTSAITAGVVDGQPGRLCTNGVSTASGSSRVDALVIGGNPVDIIADRPFDQTIGGVRIRANQVRRHHAHAR